MAHITNDISNRISNTDCTINVTLDIINDCIAKLKHGKNVRNIGFNSNHFVHDGRRIRVLNVGNIGFNSNYFVHDGRRIRVLLSLLFNAMIVHGHYPSEMLKSTVVCIPIIS